MRLLCPNIFQTKFSTNKRFRLALDENAEVEDRLASTDCGKLGMGFL